MSQADERKRSSKRFSDLPDADPACEGCGYCLRGQTLDGRCPECGTSVATSVAKVADRYAGMVAVGGQNDARRRSDLRWGPWLIVVAVVIDGIAHLLPNDPKWFVPRTAARLGAAILASAGVYASTRSVVGYTEPRAWRIMRVILRLAAFLCLVGTVVILAASGAAQWPFRQSSSLESAWCVPLAAIIGTIFFYVYALGVARAYRAKAAIVSCAIVILMVTSILAHKFYQGSYAFQPWAYSPFGQYDPLAANSILGSAFIPSQDSRSTFWPRGFGSASIIETAQGYGLQFLRSDVPGWLSLLTLIQLALMTGQRKTALPIVRAIEQSDPESVEGDR